MYICIIYNQYNIIIICVFMYQRERCLKFESDKSDDKSKSVCLQKKKKINMIHDGVSIHLNFRKLIFTSD